MAASFTFGRPAGTTFGDLLGKLAVVVVECPKCSRTGRYALRRLIEQRERDRTIIGWLDALTADCPRKRAARCLDLPKVP